MNKSYIEWIDYYKNATKEDVIQDMMLDINNIKEKDKEIERLTAESTEWESKCYKYQDIINELEKWLEDVDVFQMNFIENKEHITPYKTVLDKLKALKEGK